MKTRDVILVGVGAVFGYLLVAFMKKRKETGEEVIIEENTEVVVDQAKIDACNKMADDFMASSRFASGTDLVAVKKAKFDECMKSK